MVMLSLVATCCFPYIQLFTSLSDMFYMYFSDHTTLVLLVFLTFFFVIFSIKTQEHETFTQYINVKFLQSGAEASQLPWNNTHNRLKTTITFTKSSSCLLMIPTLILLCQVPPQLMVCPLNGVVAPLSFEKKT